VVAQYASTYDASQCHPERSEGSLALGREMFRGVDTKRSECAQHDSMVKARQVVQWMAPVLALGVAGVVPLETMVHCTSHTMASGCMVNARRKRPAAFQLVEQPKLIRGLG
jgi:hypothetical protein